MREWAGRAEQLGGYNEMTFSEKVVYARKVDDVAYRSLEVLAK